MKRAFQDEVQGTAVVMAMTMVMTILIALATEKRTLVMDVVQVRVPRMAMVPVTAARPLQIKTR